MENLLQIVVQRDALAGVENSVVGEVRRRVGLVGGDQTNKFIFRHGLERIIQTPLVAQGRDRVRR